MRITRILLAVLVVMIAALYISGFKDDSELLEQKQYCKMVHLYKQYPGASVGWPDYEERFDLDCNPDGTIKERK